MIPVDLVIVTASRVHVQLAGTTVRTFRGHRAEMRARKLQCAMIHALRRVG